MFGSIKTISGAIALLVWFIWISVNGTIQTLVSTKQVDLDSWKDGSLCGVSKLTPNYGSKLTVVRFDWNMNATQTKDM